MLHRLLALDRGGDVVGLLKVDQDLDAVLAGESLGEVMFMLVDAAHEVVGDANVQRAVPPAGEDVDVVSPDFPDTSAFS
jgi:hypothetical protein